MLVLNILPPDGKKESNQIVYLETLTKLNVLKQWEESLIYPHRYIPAFCESVKVAEDSEIEAKDLVTLTEYLDTQKVTLESKGDLARLSAKVAKKYKDIYMVKPRVVARPDEKGLYNKKAYGYADKDLTIIEETLRTFKHSRG